MEFFDYLCHRAPWTLQVALMLLLTSFVLIPLGWVYGVPELRYLGIGAALCSTAFSWWGWWR